MRPWPGMLVIVAATIVAASSLAAPTPWPEGCTDRVAGGGNILGSGRPEGLGNFSIDGGVLRGRRSGYLHYVDHDPAAAVHHVLAQAVAAYCVSCGDQDCRRLTYSPAIVDGVEVEAVIVETCDRDDPGAEDTFRICVPSRGYCKSGSLGLIGGPVGGDVRLQLPAPGCADSIATCGRVASCSCFAACAPRDTTAGAVPGGP